MTLPYRPLARILDDRRQDIDTASRAQGDFYVCTGETALGGIGESVVTVRFPVRYVAKPFASAMVDLGDNPEVVAGVVPTASALIGSWTFGVRATTGDRYYEGATFLVVTTGPPSNRPVLQWRFEGRAMTGGR